MAGAINGFEAALGYNHPNEGGDARAALSSNNMPTRQVEMQSSSYSQNVQYYMGSEQGARPPASLPRSSSRPGSQSLAILSQMGGAPASSSNPHTISNGQGSIETDFRVGVHQPSELARSSVPYGG